MNRDRLLTVLAIYEQKFGLLKVTPERADGSIIDQPHDVRLGHIAWMVAETKKFTQERRLEKANRWLGFIQGFLWAKMFYSVDELRSHNRWLKDD